MILNDPVMASTYLSLYYHLVFGTKIVNRSSMSLGGHDSTIILVGPSAASAVFRGKLAAWQTTSIC